MELEGVGCWEDEQEEEEDEGRGWPCGFEGRMMGWLAIFVLTGYYWLH